MKSPLIQVEDRVRFELGFGKRDLCVDVIYVPKQPGDPWIVLEPEENRVYYIQHYVCVSKDLNQGKQNG